VYGDRRNEVEPRTGTRVGHEGPECKHRRMSEAPRSAGRRISARIGGIAESATLAVDAKAKALKASGRPVIGFGAGEPDFPTPDYIVEAAVEACREPRNHRYTPAGGLPELKQAIAEKTRRDSGYDVRTAQVLVTNGGKQAIYEAFATILDPGDEVLLPAPYWTTYPESIRLAGGVPVEVLADETQDYKVTPAQLEAARTERTKVLLFNSPSNPTGAVYSREEVEAIGAWLVGPDDVVKAATNLQSHATSNVSNVAQCAAVAAVSGDLSAVEEMKAAFDRRRRTIVSMLNEIDGVVCPEPKGAFYAYPQVLGLLGKEVDGVTPTTSAELAELILDKVEVAAVPGEAFGSPGYLRFSYALGDDDLVEGITRLQKLFG
jgi:aspartate aminotransferase